MKFTLILVACVSLSQAGLLKSIGLDGEGSIANGHSEVANQRGNSPITLDTSRPNVDTNEDQSQTIDCGEVTNLDLQVLGVPIKACGSSVN
ncbi:hypothetical protein K7432_002172 [Basidiobolus ranarum]|uniref:Uncharacterized protein n=1 Tax=Basidiobolus ranarum TaxID=34480 RepID=A0ABR2W890_9FUNG